MRALLVRFLALAALVALAGSVPGHRPDTRDPMLAAWLAAGGALADLCADRHDEAGHAGPCCPACPPAPALGPRSAHVPAPARQWVGRVAASRIARRAPPPRRPPPGRPRAPPPSA